MPSSRTNFNILMLGKRGTGKTSMLAVLWNELKKFTSREIVYFRQDWQTSNIFGEALSQLKEMFNSPGLSIGEGIEGTDEPQDLSIELCTPNHTEPHLQLNFWDYSGGLLSAKNATEELNQKINDAHIFFIIVDAPALMELNGKFNNIRNTPDYFRNLLNNRLNEPLNVVFIVTKSEKYVRKNMKKNLFQKVKASYYELIEELRPGSNCSICIVQTLGEIVLNELLVNKDSAGREYPIYTFSKVSENSKFNPKDVTLPFQILLQNAIISSINERRASYDGLNWLRDLLGRDYDLAQALNHISEVTKVNNDSSSLVEFSDLKEII